MSNLTPVDEVFGEDSHESAVYKAMAALRSAYADMLIGKFQAVIAKCDAEHKVDIMAILNKTIGAEDDSVLSHFVTEATLCLDIMIGNLGCKANPLEGVYDAVKGQLGYTANLEPLMTNDLGWPILDTFIPGRLCIKINYRPATDEADAHKGNSVHFIRSDGELQPMIWLDDGCKKAINSALKAYGIVEDADYEECNGEWFMLSKDYVTPLREAIINDSYRLHDSVLMAEIPFHTEINSDIYQDALNNHTARMLEFLKQGRIFFHDHFEPEIGKYSQSVCLFIRDGKVINQVLVEAVTEHSLPIAISDYAKDLYDKLITAGAPELLTKDQFIYIEFKQDLEDILAE